MCEIILIVLLAKKVAAMATEKGRASAGYVVLFIVGWLGGEFIGELFGAIVNKGEMSAGVYAFALLGAAIGAGSVFMLIALLPPLEDEESYRPGRRRRTRDHYEDDYDGERRSRRDAYAGDESYREKFQAGRKREVDEQSEEVDPEAGYRLKRESNEE